MELGTTLQQEVKNFYTFSRQRVLPAKDVTFDDLYLSHTLYKRLEHWSPHQLYHFAVVNNDAAWYNANEWIIKSEEFSEAAKIECMLDDTSEFWEYKYEIWKSLDDMTDSELTETLLKFDTVMGQKWDVNSAARTVIDNLLRCTWHYREVLTKE